MYSCIRIPFYALCHIAEERKYYIYKLSTQYSGLIHYPWGIMQQLSYSTFLNAVSVSDSHVQNTFTTPGAQGSLGSLFCMHVMHNAYSCNVVTITRLTTL